MEKKSFSDTLRQLRKEKGLLQKDLAREISFSEKTVSKWERGASTPPLEILPKLAEILGCDINALFEYEPQPSYFLGIDGGGTKTAFVLVDEEGKVIHETTLSAANPVDVGMERTKAVLSEGISTVCKNIPYRRISMFAGIAGGTTGKHREEIHDFLSSFHFNRFDNGSDLENALAASMESEEGIVSIMGTGTITIAVKDGVRHRFGGYGYFFDEGGSGFDIGRAAISISLRAAEGSAGKTLLQELCEQKAGGTLLEHLGEIYEGGKALVAEYAPLVIQASGAGDPAALEILRNSLRNYTDVLRKAMEMYDERPVPVYLIGGLTKSDHLWSVLMELMEEIPGMKLYRVRRTPVEGALLLARRNGGAYEG